MSLFTKIAKGEIPSWKIAENDKFFAFLDINPLAKGHALVIPKLEVDYIFDIEDDNYSQFWLFAKKVARAIENAVPCQKIGIAVIGLEVRHAHIHLIPINSVNDMNFALPKLSFTEDEFRSVCEAIKNEFGKL